MLHFLKQQGYPGNDAAFSNFAEKLQRSISDEVLTCDLLDRANVDSRPEFFFERYSWMNAKSTDF
jgi:hypothetical protein